MNRVKGSPWPSDSHRFWAKVDLRDMDGCWLWTAGTNRGGYGGFNVRNGGRPTTARAHRYAYEQLVGYIPDGLQLDHLCRNRLCVNPNHLEPVSSRTNVLRGEGLAAHNATKVRCGQGHPYEEGERLCKECRNASARARYDPAQRHQRYLEGLVRAAS
jgi:hypothetical protein